jgi:hypothetical protein
MGFVTAIPEAMLGVGAATAGLSAGHAALVPVAAGAGAVVAPGLDEVSIVTAARVTENAEHVAATLGLGSVVKGLYGFSIDGASTLYTITDEAGAAVAGAVV